MFEEMPPLANKATATGPDEVRVSTRRGPRDSFLVTVHVGRRVAERLDLDPGDKARVAWGTGPDLGKVKIAAAARGAPGWTVRAGGKAEGGVKVTASRLPDGLARAAVKRAVAAHEVLTVARENNLAELLVRLPRALVPDAKADRKGGVA